jgi:hypothetical protein
MVAMRPTLTGNTQAAVRFNASVAVQETSVDPTGKVVPDGGSHATVTGVWPPSASGVGYVTNTPLAEVLLETGDGQARVGAAGGGGVATGGGPALGAVGVELEQSAAASNTRKQTAYLAMLILCKKPSDAIPADGPTTAEVH